MSADLITMLLLLCAALFVFVLFGARILRGSAASTGLLIARLAAAVLAAAILIWMLWSQKLAGVAPAAPVSETPAAAAAAAVTAPAAPLGDPVPTAIAALQDCSAASPPPPPPDGTKASREQMLAARAAFQQYDAATNSYLKCVDLTIERVTQQFPAASAADRDTLKTLGNGAHNTAIDQEQAVADQLNLQVRAFKAKHPGP